MEYYNQPHLLINSTLVTSSNEAKLFEFVLNNNLKVIECGYVSSLANGTVKIIEDFVSLSGALFEFNHVRINPKLENSRLLQRLRNVLQKSGVTISDPTDEKDIKVLYNPVGQLSEVVRFFLTDQNYLKFLSPARKFTII